VGWNATPPYFSVFPNFGQVTEEQQATYAVEAYERAAGEWPWMGVMNYWFFRRPTDAERNQTMYYFRMVEPDFTPLPVYEALSELANQPPTVSVGHHQQDHWALRYEGPWQEVSAQDAVLGSYTLGGAGAELVFFFRGTDLTLVLRGPGPAELPVVLVDGVRMRIRPAKAGPYPGTLVVTVASRLADARHRAQIRVTGDGLALDGLIVTRRRGAVGVVAAYAAGCAAIALLTCALHALLRRKGRHDA